MMDTNGHYEVLRSPHTDEVRFIKCRYCQFASVPRQFFRAGDKSGLGRYNRARAVIVKHLHESHREQLERNGTEPPRASKEQ